MVLKLTHHIISGISSPSESNTPHNYVDAPYIIFYQASYDAMSLMGRVSYMNYNHVTRENMV